MNGLWQDLRFAARTLLARPGFLIVALLSLGLGIGANTAIFSLIDAVMLRILPVSHPERLVLLTDPGWSGVAVETTERGTRNVLSYPEFEQLRVHNSVFSGMFAAQSALSDLEVLTGRGQQSVKAHVQLVSGEFFDVLGVQPILGRAFTPQEDRVQGANPVGVISYGFWQREFSGDASVIGRTVRVGQSSIQILGVTPAGFRGVLVGADADLWIPITMQPQVLTGRDYLKPVDTLWLQV
ncbi:MAG TPA: ABC transporter permease, partial [Bryobacteraceae bacterium]